ncbi:MAG: DoxX family protein [Chlorobi bacterium]|nr:DoxX family protein [Chlorobiota bacterium]
MGKATKILVDIVRFAVGVLFIFSGMIKLVDPLGTAYKLEEYFEVFRLPEFFNNLSLFLSIAFSSAEVSLGVALIVGWMPTLTTIALLGLIIFFTFLTGYSAITGAVTDCGCFGDFIKLTPWQSFYKDIVLTVLILFLFINRKHISPGGKVATVLTGIATVFAVLFGIWNYLTLPLIDFRPYKAGNNIWELMQVPPGAPQDVYETILVYRNKQTGDVVEMTSSEFVSRYQEFQDTTVWEFVSSESKLVQKGYTPPIHDFVLLDSSGNDVTAEVLNQSGTYLFVIVYPSRFSERGLKEVVEELKDSELPVFVLTAFPSNEWENIKQEVGVPALWKTLYVDATALKTFIRSSPGVVLMNGPVVVDKWHWRTFSKEDLRESLSKIETIEPDHNSDLNTSV